MSKLSRKTKAKEKMEEANAKKVMLYLVIGLLVVAVVVGLIVNFT